MKLTKEDYMCLPKERLAELLVERDMELAQPTVPSITPYVPEQPFNPPYNPWWQEYQIIC